MRLLVLALTLALALCAASVVPVTPDTFEAVTTAQPTFLAFRAAWCSHSQEAGPVLAELAELLPGTAVAELDCVAHRAFCQAHGVKEYPDLRYYTGGTEIRYHGTRRAQNIASWVGIFED